MNVERMKELTNMKALRYLLTVVMLSVASMVFATAQSLAQKPEAQMKSTSGMVYSGSTLPQAATTGAYVTGNSVGSYSPAGTTSGPNRAKRGLDDDDEGEVTIPQDNTDPDFSPIGDAAIPLMLLCFAYAIYKVRRRMHA